MLVLVRVVDLVVGPVPGRLFRWLTDRRQANGQPRRCHRQHLVDRVCKGRARRRALHHVETYGGRNHQGLVRRAGPLGIRLLAIAPSMTQTEGRAEFLERYTTAEIREFITDMEQRVPLGRIGVADDVARVGLFAASDMSMLMTGSVLFVDSGKFAL